MTIQNKKRTVFQSFFYLPVGTVSRPERIYLRK